MAAASGGRYVPLDRLDDLAGEWKAKECRMEPRLEERALWSAPGWVLLMALFFGAEWFFRKRWDLL
jgi:hypothetical protein